MLPSVSTLTQVSSGFVTRGLTLCDHVFFSSLSPLFLPFPSPPLPFPLLSSSSSLPSPPLPFPLPPPPPFSSHMPSPPTGLKEAQDKVNDYSPLMKDFPINDLLAAGTLQAIKDAVAAIYTHLKKIRTTSYPAQRGVYLVEAISRDLSTQLLKVW